MSRSRSRDVLGRSALLHAVQRTPTALLAVISDVTADGHLEVVEKTLVPGPEESALFEAFARLGSVRGLEASARADVALVLASSVAPEPIRPMPHAVFDAPVVTPRASAAHPRAYRGTKDKPPKLAHPNVTDVRPMLCHPSTTARLAARLGLPSLEQPPSWFGRLFARTLRGHGEAYAQRVLGLATRYGLAQDAQLATWCARLLLVHDALGFAWFEVLDDVPPHVRLTIVRTLASRAVVVSPEIVGDATLDVLASAIDVARCESLFGVVIDAHVDGTNADFIIASLRSRVLCEPWNTQPIAKISRFAHDIPTLMDTLVPDADPYVRLDLLDAVARVRCFEMVMRQIEWAALDRPRTIALRTLLWYVGHVRPVSGAEARCSALLAARRPLVVTLCSIRDTRVGVFAKELYDVLDVLVDEARSGDGLDEALSLLTRLGRFEARHACGGMVATVLRLPREERSIVLASPDSSLEVMLHESRRRNDQTLHTYGLNALALTSPSLFARTFRDAPKALLRTAKWVGTLAYETRMGLMRALRTHPILEAAAESSALEDLVAMIDDAAGRDAGIVPRVLRLHLEGAAHLKPMQLARHVAMVRESLDRARLRLFERAAIRSQLAALGLPETALAHRATAAHAAAADENRRPMRRMLRAYFEGDRAYVLRHPETVAWQRAQTGFDVDAWLGCSLEQWVDTSRGRVRLAVEHDPLEALKLGTYVGSCLGLGGGLTYSAAAVVLDANKHVVYARTETGEVIARQLVAIADSGRVVAYAVYGDAALELVGAFRAFDDELATLIGSTLVSDDDDYYVPTVLARGFWDDGRLRDDELMRPPTSAQS